MARPTSGAAIRKGIEAHNTLEQSHGFAHGTPAEFETALAALIVDLVGLDRLVTSKLRSEPF